MDGNEAMKMMLHNLKEEKNGWTADLLGRVDMSC